MQLSVFHFLRKFRSEFGCPPHDYVMRRRIEHAKRQLARRDIPLKRNSPQSTRDVFISSKQSRADPSHRFHLVRAGPLEAYVREFINICGVPTPRHTKCPSH